MWEDHVASVLLLLASVLIEIVTTTLLFVVLAFLLVLPVLVGAFFVGSLLLPHPVSINPLAFSLILDTA